MDLSTFLNDKALKAKEKTEMLSNWLLEHKVPAKELIAFAQASKDPTKATCIEAFEFATKQQPELIDAVDFQFFAQSLQSAAPRVKWESAKVIGNTAARFYESLDTAIAHLLDNTAHEGTVVRWSAAYALGEIIKLKTKHNEALLPFVKTICGGDEKNSIKKIYLDALKKSSKK